MCKGGMYISLIFIGNELLHTSKRRDLRLPLDFITFAFIEGKLYKHYQNQGTFALRYGRSWGNDVVYGAIFSLRDYDFYIRLLDSYHQCSASLLGRNHNRDIHHRINTKATPISFETIDEFERLKYRERSEEEVQAYVGNINHPKINQRLDQTISYRITDGIDKNFIQLFREVTQ